MSEQITAWIKTRRDHLDAATPGPWEAGETQHFHEGAFHAVYAEVEPSICAGCSPEDAAAIADARTTLPVALNALEAVLERHQPVWIRPVDPDEEVLTACAACSESGLSPFWVAHPCADVRAIAEALGVATDGNGWQAAEPLDAIYDYQEGSPIVRPEIAAALGIPLGSERPIR